MTADSATADVTELQLTFRGAALTWNTTSGNACSCEVDSFCENGGSGRGREEGGGGGGGGWGGGGGGGAACRSRCTRPGVAFSGRYWILCLLCTCRLFVVEM